MPSFIPDAELRYRTIFEGAGVAIVVMDPDGTIVECNSATVELFGYSAEQLRRMRLRDIAHPDDLNEQAAKFEELMSGRLKHYQIQTRYIRHDKSVIWAVLTVSLVPTPNLETHFAIGVIENIIERKRAEEALLASREHLEASVRASRTGLWDWDLQSNEIYYSPGWKSQLGFTEEEISTGLDETFNRIHPEDRQRTINGVLEFIQSPRPSFETEFRLRHKDGSYRWMLSRASVLRGPDETPARLLGAHLDITERKRSEERLREYEKVIESLHELITVVDREYRYLLANRAFLNYCNLTRDEVVGHLMAEIMDQETFDKIARPKLDDCFQGQFVQYELKTTYPKYGSRQMSISYFPIEGAQGVDSVACVLEDVTDRKRADHELRRAHERLTRELQERTRAEQNVRALSDRLITAQEEERRIIARELHDDLSQEIAALSISISNLRHSVPEENRALRAQTEAVQQRSTHLAERVRHLARKLHPAVLEYSGIAAALKSYAVEFSGVNGITISVEAEGTFEDVPAPIGLCLYRVTQEALQNVVKHSNASSAKVRIQRHPGAINLMIKDPGQGFSEPKASAERGLGLVSMSERVRLVQGAIEIQSAPGEGTTISVSIPC